MLVWKRSQGRKNNIAESYKHHGTKCTVGLLFAPFGTKFIAESVAWLSNMDFCQQQSKRIQHL